ncbi:hypothetical protein [Serratia sp. UGAL515B_01]|uniref:hypothetical protein n=1 Tax=Serratia sp. UGAL515B_01 TaxID=2986763 RepID=UPI0029551001|nr:hypothetical protein [Serratia sp. UGAL515B_01]WON78053.1 hypothetical protein OK023_05105 [Serratia sp. UGAL515B_01]
MEYTVEQLLSAIRGAESLEELQRMIGPSEEDSQANVARLAKLDRFFEQYGAYSESWPEHAKSLLAEQNRFESAYC